LASSKALTLDSIFNQDTFAADLPKRVRWLDSGEGFTYLENSDQDTLARVWMIGEAEPKALLPLNALSGLPADFAVSDLIWSEATGFALLKGLPTRNWEGYEEAAYYVWDPARETTWPLVSARKKLRLVKMSPDGRTVGFVDGNNLYVVETATGEIRAVTTDGDKHIFNGIFDYGSTEFGPRNAWFWSPDGRSIAFWRLDATAVPFYSIIDPLTGYPEVRRFHYPNTEQPHAVYQIGVHALDTGKTLWLDTEHDADDYLPHLSWFPSSNGLFVQRLTRNHQILDVLRFDFAESEMQRVVRDTQPTWLDVTLDMIPLSDDAFLWTSEKTGWRHIYQCQVDKPCRQLTSGNWSMDSLLAVDADHEWVYFYGKRDSLIDQHVYRVPLAGGEAERVTKEAGWHVWQIAPQAEHAVAIHSTANSPPSLSLIRTDGATLVTLVEDSVPALADYTMGDTEFVSFETGDGIMLNGFFIKPTNFDPDKQYPVIAYGYGNAGSQVVVNRWGTQRGPQQDLWHRYMAEQDYVIFAVDNRTTQGRGKAAKNLTYGEYGKYAVLDYIQAVDYLKTLPWIDGSRIGFWGWSGGGYLAAALMTKAAPRFSVAVSVAPVIDLRHYQAVGVERWMGTPSENQSGYDAVNVMNDADKLEGKLLLVHGTGDENVKYAFTLQFADALIRADKQFDMLIYPNQRHGISDFRGHVFKTMTRYFKDHL
jgi:dipeptidyl-peptidase-4